MNNLHPVDPDDLDDLDIDWPDWDEPDPLTELARQATEDARKLGLSRPVKVTVTTTRVPKPTGDDRPLFDGLDGKRGEDKKT